MFRTASDSERPYGPISTMDIVEALQCVVEGRDLSRQQAGSVMDQIMTGRSSDAQIAALLTALRMKGESVEELTGFADVMRRKAALVDPSGSSMAGVATTGGERLVDTCGTGGDASGTFNISTAAAFVAAGAGVRVAKHGNRSVSSLCGSADVLEALGVRIELPAPLVARCIDEVGIGFLYAPVLHQAMKFVMPARRQLKIRTVFNLLGPLTNPARAQAQLMGVYARPLVEKLAAVLSNLGTERAMVVHGEDGLDEITLTGPTWVAELASGQMRSYPIDPRALGFRLVSLADLQGGDAQANAAIIRDILSGSHGPGADVVCLNAAAAIYVAGLASDLHAAVQKAKASLASGAAQQRLQRMVRWTQENVDRLA